MSAGRSHGRHLRSVVIVVAVAAGSIASVEPASAQVDPNAWVITEDTTLTEDFDGVIWIEADGVTLDCDGHTIVADYPDVVFQGVFINDFSNVTVQNCVVRASQIGISSSGVGNRILSNTISFGEYGAVVNGEDNVVEGNTFTSDVFGPLQNGLLVGGGSSNRIVGNDFVNIEVAAMTDGNWGLNEYEDSTCVDSVSDPVWLCDDSLDGPFSDDDTSVFQDAIEWLHWAEITAGRDTRMYCPNRSVTRGEMAMFISRALDLRLVDPNVDYFTDDDGELWELAANKLFEAGITAGCGGTNFCGEETLSREQMAVMLVRALDLPETGTDHFTDDEDSPFEDHINRVAEAGITQGCNPPDNDHFCPEGSVTRGQMAAFFKRSWGPGVGS